MYGTIARMRAKPGMADQLRAMRDEQMQSGLTSLQGMVMYQSSNDPDEYWLVVAFESREAYEANASSAEQHERFTRMRALLDADPEWHDGNIVDAFGSFRA
jgi:quinol monooxygenase YgiN